MMNSRDLVRGLVDRSRFDRVAAADNFWPETLDAWVAQGYPTRTVIEDGAEAIKPEDPQQHLDLDLWRCGSAVNRYPILGFEQVLEESDEWILKRDGAGAAFKTWKRKFGTPEHVDFFMKSREIWDRDYRPHLLSMDPRRIEPKKDREALQRVHGAGKASCISHIFIFEVMRQSMGDFTMYENVILDPGWVRDFNRVYTDFYIAHHRALYAEAGAPDLVQISEDLGYRDRLFISPTMLEDMFLPYYIEMVRFHHAHGVRVIFHSCGKTTEALPLILATGSDVLNPMEVKAGNDLFGFARAHGDRLAFKGGLDVRVLETGDRDLIRREVIRVVEGMKALGARYIFGSDHSVTPRVSYDSYRCALDAYREHMMY